MPTRRAYIRGSKDEIKVANQVPDVEAEAARRGWTIDKIYAEHESAAKRRPVFEQMLKDAEAHRFDTLIIWQLDRFGRSLVGNLDDIRRLDRAGVSVVSCKETWLDTTTGPLRHLLVSIFSYVAESERANLISRTNAGLARAKSEGIKLGRRKLGDELFIRVAELCAEGCSLTDACKRTTYTTDSGKVKSVSPRTFQKWNANKRVAARQAGETLSKGSGADLNATN